MNKLVLENYLLILKSTVEVYVHGTLESSNEDVKKLLCESLNDTLNHQKNTYNVMTTNGFYQTCNIDSEAIDKTLKKISQN